MFFSHRMSVLVLACLPALPVGCRFSHRFGVLVLACLLALPVGCRKEAQKQAAAPEVAEEKPVADGKVAAKGEEAGPAAVSGPGKASSAVKAASPPPEAEAPSPPKNPTLALLEAAGDKAALVLVVRPEQWKEFGDVVRPFLAPVSARLGIPVEVLEAPTLWRAFLLRLGGEWKGVEAVPIEGLDEARPVVVALFEANLGPVALGARFMAFANLQEGGPGIAHRLLLPATDSAQLAASLSAALEAAGVRRRSEAQGWEELKGGALYVPSSIDGFLAVIPEAGYVRLEMNAFETHEPPADKGGFLAAWREVLGRSPAVKELPRTPALEFAAAGDHFAVAYFRPWALRDAALQLAAAAGAMGIREASADRRQATMANAVATARSAGLLMSPEGAEVDDLAVGVDARNGLRLKAVASLTEYGVKLVRAGMKSATPAPEPVENGVVDLTMTFDLGAYFSAVEIPGYLDDLEDVGESQQAFHQCGTACYVYTFVRGTSGIWKWTVKKGGIGEGAENWLPSSASLSLRSVTPDTPESPLSFAFTTQVPAAAKGASDLDFSFLEELLGGSLMYEVRAEEGRGKVWGGINADPAKVFDQQKARPAGHLLAVLKVKPERLAPALAAADPALAGLATAVGQFDVLVWFAGQALVTEVVVGPSGGLTVPYTSGPDWSGFRWESPDLARYRSKGGRCLAKVAADMAKAFDALAMATPGKRQDLLRKTVEEYARANLDCAIADPLTRDEAMAADLMLTLMIVQPEGVFGPADPDTDLDRLRLLAAGCKRGHKRLCNMLKTDTSEVSE